MSLVVIWVLVSIGPAQWSASAPADGDASTASWGPGAPSEADPVSGSARSSSRDDEQPVVGSSAESAGLSPSGEIGPDLTFCRLYDLRQFGREGDVVGLAAAMGTWNIGDVPVPWYAFPDPNHPFKTLNLFRLRTADGQERFEQIGQSWVMHGFCALGAPLCGGTCGYTGCDTLGVGCVNVSSSSLFAFQQGHGPRFEVNPWTRAWSYEGSHFEDAPHDHDGVEHRLQVHDADLDPALNEGATYLLQVYHVCPEDVDTMNSAAWRPVLVVSGSPGGTWDFQTDGPMMDQPDWGFAIDAWDGATQTVLAQERPVIEFESPDGRCILAAKATELGAETWHYEYALLNVDMDRQVGAFTIPLAPGTTVTNVGFHAVEHDEEYNAPPPEGVPIDNASWEVTIEEDAITWSTATNPLRWGTLYNFRFEADAPPVYATQVTLGHFKPGDPETVTGATVGPLPAGPDCNGNGLIDACDLACGPAGGVCDVPGCGQSGDADGDGVPDECAGIAIVSSDPPDNAIDARQPYEYGGGNPAGWDGITLVFDGEAGDLMPEDFVVTVEPDDVAPPQIASLDVSGDTATLQFDEIIPLVHWTRVTQVANGTGVRIGYLPADVNNDRYSGFQDVLALIDALNGVHEFEDYQLDINRDGEVTPQDVLRVIDLFIYCEFYCALGTTLPD